MTRHNMFGRIIVMLLASVLWNAAPAQEVRELKLTPLQGEGAFNDIKRHTAEDVAVMVKDEAGQPVAGAQVIFTLPYSGAGGTFDHDQRSYTATSGMDGRAVAGTMHPNSVEGRFNILVSATFAGMKASTVVSQTNTLAATLPGEHGHGKLILILALLAGAGAGVGLAVGRGGSSSQAAPSGTTLAAGPITVGGPR